MPEAPDPACQQIPYGVPAISADELFHLLRNGQAYKLYGVNPIAQIALTANFALRRGDARLLPRRLRA